MTPEPRNRKPLPNDYKQRGRVYCGRHHEPLDADTTCKSCILEQMELAVPPPEDPAHEDDRDHADSHTGGSQRDAMDVDNCQASSEVTPAPLTALRALLEDIELVANSLHDVAMIGWAPTVNAQRWAYDNETCLRSSLERLAALLDQADAEQQRLRAENQALRAAIIDAGCVLGDRQDGTFVVYRKRPRPAKRAQTGDV